MKLECRMSLQAESRTVSGYVALYDEPTMFHGKVETIHRGAFRKSLAEVETGERRIYALYNHDAKQVLAHTGNQSLRLIDTDRGLWAEIDIPEDREDVMNRVSTGLADGASFGFVGQGAVISEKPGARHMVELQLREVTVTEAPAYLATTRSAYYDVEHEDVLPEVPADLKARIDAILGPNFDMYNKERN